MTIENYFELGNSNFNDLLLEIGEEGLRNIRIGESIRITSKNDKSPKITLRTFSARLMTEKMNHINGEYMHCLNEKYDTYIITKLK